MINQNYYNTEEVEKWIAFRHSLSSLFSHRNRAVMNLIDSLSSNFSAQTAVQLSENDLFNYNYSSLYQGINNCFSPENETRKEQIKQKQSLIFSSLNIENKLPFNLLAIDATTIERKHSPTLIDREFVHKPSPIFGQKPITLGHKYSVLTYLTQDEKKQHNWSIPLSTERIDSGSTDSQIGQEQVNILLDNSPEYLQDNLLVITGDSHYSNQYFLGNLTNHKNLVTLTRCRSSRVFYTLPKIDNTLKKRRGHPCWYGERFDLKDESTWPETDEEFSRTITNKRKEILNLDIKCWNNLIMKGNKEQKMWQNREKNGK